MRQYHSLLKHILNNGTQKPPARANMPGSKSIFGYQMRFDLLGGNNQFLLPLLTTKKMFTKAIIIELLWFLRGDNNVKYLVDNGCNIWTQDAFAYYCRKVKEFNFNGPILNFTQFEQAIKDWTAEGIIDGMMGYRLGDCGAQYGRVWRAFGTDGGKYTTRESDYKQTAWDGGVDQIKRQIQMLRLTPESRRHLVSAVDVLHDEDVGLYWCHSLFQFNCRPMTFEERYKEYFKENTPYYHPHYDEETPSTITDKKWWTDLMDEEKINVPKYFLDCQLYQRSADTILGVPFNIASYAMLVYVMGKLTNTIPGEFIHTFGDVHIYDNHLEAANEQLTRDVTKYNLPSMKIKGDETWKNLDIDKFDEMISGLTNKDFEIIGYESYPKIEAELSTGIVK